MAYLGVVEQGVVAPRERFGALVEPRVGGDLLLAMLVFLMLHVSMMSIFNSLHVVASTKNCEKHCTMVGSSLWIHE